DLVCVRDTARNDVSPGEGVPNAGVADEVDRLATGVEVVAEPAELAHQALPPAGRRSRPRFSASSPESLWPLLKKENLASHDTIGLVNQKKTSRSISVDSPRANAKPFTTPAAKMYRTTAARIDTESAATQ